MQAKPIVLKLLDLASIILLAIAAFLALVYAPEELSKVFTGYFQTLDQFQKMDSDRRSPISDYLDRFDH